MRGLFSLALLVSRPALIIIIPLIGHFIYNLWGSVVAIFTSPSLGSFKDFFVQFGMLIIGSQQMIYTSVHELQKPGIEFYRLIHHAELVIAGSLISILLIFLLWKILKGMSASYGNWDIVSKILMFVMCVVIIGTLGSAVAYINTGSFTIFYHGWWEIIKIIAAHIPLGFG